MQHIALIFGGNGLVGRTTRNELTKRGWKVVTVDKKKPPSTIETYKQADILQKGTIETLVSDYSPEIIINCVNVATICSKDAPKNYNDFIGFYTELYRSIRKLNKKTHYLQVGTTGAGGLGFNIPFTHGDNIEDLPIIHKAAFAGITSGLLSMLSRSFTNGTRISEIKPGLAIFDPILKSVEFEGTETKLIDGGESGSYTYDELALLTSFMGFTTVDKIVDKLLAILTKKQRIMRSTVYNLTDATNQSIISQDSSDIKKKHRILSAMRPKKNSTYIIATGNLGPPEITRDLILSTIVYSNKNLTPDQFKGAQLINTTVQLTLDYIKKTNSELYNYLISAVSYQEYKRLCEFWAQKLEPWAIVKKSLEKTTNANIN